MKELIYSYIRIESTNELILLLNADTSWLEVEIDINITSDNKLKIDFLNKYCLISKTLESELLNQLTTKETIIYFVNDDMKVISKIKIAPIEIV